MKKIITHRMNFNPRVRDLILVTITSEGVSYRQVLESAEMNFSAKVPKSHALGLLRAARMRGVLERGLVT